MGLPAMSQATHMKKNPPVSQPAKKAQHVWSLARQFRCWLLAPCPPKWATVVTGTAPPNGRWLTSPPPGTHKPECHFLSAFTEYIRFFLHAPAIHITDTRMRHRDMNTFSSAYAHSHATSLFFMFITFNRICSEK